MKIVASIALALAGLFVMSPVVHAQYADAVVSYEPGTGFAAGYTNASSALGAPALGSSVNPMAAPFSKSQLVSIGAGGEITLQMSTPITDNPSDPYGLDFILFANSFFIASGGSGQNETTSGSLFYHPASTLIQVSADGVNWYTLNPMLAPQPGEWFPSYGGGNPQIPVNPALATTNFAGMTLGQIESLYNGSAGGTGYSLSWAVDANSNSVDLASIDYVSIQVQSGVVDLDAISDVPEPSTFALLLAGGTWLGFRFKKLKPKRSNFLRVCLILLFGLLAGLSARAVTFTENFTNDPAQNGWQVFGDTNLFQWDSANDVMDVTWDSTQPNSYFYHPLGTTLTIADSFTICFDIQLNDLQCQPNPGIANLGVGLFNYNDATNSGFSRPDGFTPDLFEFDYYPDDGLDGNPEMAASLTDDVGGVTNYPDFYFIYNESPMNDSVTYHVVLSHMADEAALSSTVYTNGQVYATMGNAYFEGFTDFFLDTIAISSYEQDSSYDAYDLLAHGTVGNFVVTFPGVSRNLIGTINNGVFQVNLGTYTNWNYLLERSTNLLAWSAVTPCVSGTGQALTLCDTNAPATAAFYRVQANMP